MDENQLANRVSVLPARYADRIDPIQATLISRHAAAGEWGETVDALTHALRGENATITNGERDELAELLAACGLPTAVLDGITVTS